MIIKPKWLQKVQAQQAELFRAEGFPTRKQEDWKYTPVGIIAEKALGPRVSSAIEEIGSSPALEPLQLNLDLNREAFYQLLILDGQWRREYSNCPDEKQVRISTWSEQYAQDPEWLKTLFFQFSKAKTTPFTHLNQANFEDGLIIQVQEDCLLDRPIQILYFNSDRGEWLEQHPHCLMVLGKNARATFLETHEDRNSQSTFHNGLTHVHLHEGAKLDYFKLSPENDQSLHISSMAFFQEKDSVAKTYHFGLGGRLVRDDLHINLKNAGASCELYGFYALNGAEHYDCHSRIDHVSSMTSSQQIYKGIVDGKARGVFNGKIFVHPHLQKISARQRNNNLLLSKTAEMNTKPELEIYSEDVSCSHGATIGELDEEALFYLRSRGIPEAEAKQLLTHAFAAEIFEKSSSSSSAYVYQRILKKLSGGGSHDRT